MKYSLVRDTEATQGHDLVMLLQDKIVTWVFWRGGWAVSYGIEAGNCGPHFARDAEGEKSDQANMGGFTSWVVLDCTTSTAFYAGDDPLLCAEVVGPASKKELARLDKLVEESFEQLSKFVGHEPPQVIRRVIAESMAIGIAVKDGKEVDGGE